MAGTAQQGVCKPTGETWEINNLYVADGSSMPTATGVNPMMSTE
ncbi:MAG: GMC oxidoreductase [Chloroflexota bacterium]